MTSRPSASARWTSVAAVAAVVSLVALVALGVWTVRRPGASAGEDLAAVRGTPPSATATPTATASPTEQPSVRRSLPSPRVRDASLDALTVSTASAPTRLVIAALGVDARVDAVGVEKDGAMVIPAAPTSVGWYRYGSAPGDPAGHTVIAGHVATREDGPGALAPLRGAEPGMRVTVTTADGQKHRYEVVGREAIVKKALPVDEIFARDGRPLLVLITCGGEYLPELRSHRDNIVVTAAPV